MVSMIPFDLVRLDNTEGGGDNKLPVMDRILNLGKVSTAIYLYMVVVVYPSFIMLTSALFGTSKNSK